MKRILIIFFLLFIIACSGCNGEQGDYPVFTPGSITPSSERTSMYALIIDPQKYEGERVTVQGALYVDGNGLAVYASGYDGAYDLHVNAIWLGEFVDIGIAEEEELRALDGQQVEVTGVIIANKFGPDGLYNCEMKEIERISYVEKVQTLPTPKPRMEE